MNQLIKKNCFPLTNNYSYFEGEKFMPIFDQFMVIPGNLLEDYSGSGDFNSISLKQK